MLNFEDALQRAQDAVDNLQLAARDQFEIIQSATESISEGWIFYFNTVEYLRTGNPISALAGNGPILVLRDGSVHHLSSALPLQEALKNITI